VTVHRPGVMTLMAFCFEALLDARFGERPDPTLKQPALGLFVNSHGSDPIRGRVKAPR